MNYSLARPDAHSKRPHYRSLSLFFFFFGYDFSQSDNLGIVKNEFLTFVYDHKLAWLSDDLLLSFKELRTVGDDSGPGGKTGPSHEWGAQTQWWPGLFAQHLFSSKHIVALR